MRGLQLVVSATRKQSGKMVVSDWGRGSATSDEVAEEELSEEVWDLKHENSEDVGNARPARGHSECLRRKGLGMLREEREVNSAGARWARRDWCEVRCREESGQILQGPAGWGEEFGFDSEHGGRPLKCSKQEIDLRHLKITLALGIGQERWAQGRGKAKRLVGGSAVAQVRVETEGRIP